MGLLSSFVKNGEIRPSLCYQITLEQPQRKEINSILGRNNSDFVPAHFGNKNTQT